MQIETEVTRRMRGRVKNLVDSVCCSFLDLNYKADNLAEIMGISEGIIKQLEISIGIKATLADETTVTGVQSGICSWPRARLASANQDQARP